MTAPAPIRGRLRIFMGYAAGVGKTFKMLEEAQELRARGIDVVVGYFEPHGRPDTIALTKGLEFVPRRVLEYRGSRFEEMDACAILARRPAVVLVDEFPHTNVPGAERSKRWEDVDVILNAGIDVFTTMNIQHLESLNDHVWTITGVRVRETVPDWMVERAAEVVMVHLTPRALVHRLERGVVYDRAKAERARQNFFKESTLVALRELALRQTAHEVQHRIAAAPAGSPVHKVLVLVTADPETAMAIRRARRVADFLEAECFAVAVETPGARDALDRHLNFARNLHMETRVLEGEGVAACLVDFARRNRVAQIYLARPHTSSRLPWSRRDLVQQIVALATDMEIVIVSPRP